MKRARGRGKAGSVGMATSAKAWRKPFAGEERTLGCFFGQTGVGKGEAAG